MSRDSTTSVTSAAQLSQLRYTLLCHVDSLSSGAVRACLGNRFISTGVTTYTPVGGWGGISDPIAEDADPFPRSVRLWFAAVSTYGLLQEVINESLFNKPVKLYRCFLNDASTVVGTPQLLASYRANKVSLKTGDEQRGNYFEVECESRLRRTPRAQYYDKTTLQQVFSSSGDTYFDYTYQIQTARAKWGQLPNYLPGIDMPWFNPSLPSPGTYDPTIGNPLLPPGGPAGGNP